MWLVCRQVVGSFDIFGMNERPTSFVAWCSFAFIGTTNRSLSKATNDEYMLYVCLNSINL
jgi:hypothetical protein